jgi:hypothetical protein
MRRATDIVGILALLVYAFGSTRASAQEDEPRDRSRLLATRRCAGVTRYAAVAVVPADPTPDGVRTYRVSAVIDGNDPEPYAGGHDDAYVPTNAYPGVRVIVQWSVDLDGDGDLDWVVAYQPGGCAYTGACTFGVWLRCGDDFVDVYPVSALDIRVERVAGRRPRVVVVRIGEEGRDEEARVRIPQVARDCAAR